MLSISPLPPQPVAEALLGFDCGKAYLNRPLRMWLERPGTRGYLFASQEGQLAGYLHLTRGEQLGQQLRRAGLPDAPDPLVIEHLAVDLRFQGQGVGAVLVAQALALAESQALNSVLASPADEDSEGFWAHSGFAPLSLDWWYLRV